MNRPRVALPLSSKLNVPVLRRGIIERERLESRLESIWQYRLTLVVAPAGYGKTTLLSRWAHEHAHSTAWLSLDARDNDPSRFWTHLITALQSLFPTVGERSEQLLSSPRDFDAEQMIESLVSDFAGVSPPAALILDDLHLIEAPAVHEVMSLLINQAAWPVHLVIAARHNPPWALPRLRARAQLLEIGTQDLHFTLEETKAFLEQTAGLTLSSEEISILQRRTEGWIAGLQLAALALREKESRAEFMQGLERGHRLILDYLADEILKGQSEEVQEFLIQTSILDRLNASLCDALLDRCDSAQVLSRLEGGNLFVIPLDPRGDWYRYHELFTDLLRSRLAKTHPELVRRLHSKAGLWFAEQDLVEEAVQQALLAQEYERAVTLLNQSVSALLARSEVRAVLAWLELLPGEFVRSDPNVCLLFGSALALSARFEEAEALLKRVEELTRRKTAMDSGGHGSVGKGYKIGNALPAATVIQAALQETDTTEAWVGIFRAFMMRFRDDHQAIALSWKALAEAPAGEATLRSRALLCVGHANLLKGKTDEAAQALEEARTIALSLDHIPTYLGAVDYLAQVRSFQGRLREASVLYREALQRAARAQPMYAGIDWIGVGSCLCESNELQEARHHLGKGLQLAEQGGDFVFVLEGLIACSRLEGACGHFDEALCLLQRAEDLVKPSRMYSALVRVRALKTHLWLRQGNLAEAEEWAQSCGFDAREPLDYSNADGFMTLLELHIAQENFEQSDPLLERLLEEVQAKGFLREKIRLLVLKGLSQKGQGKFEEAKKSLNQALHLGEKEHYVRTFTDFGRGLDSLLLDLRTHRRKASTRVPQFFSRKYLNEVIASFDDGHLAGNGAQLGVRRGRAALQALTERELRVLLLVAGGSTNLDIAHELVLSEGTVRRHMHNICSKLDARNRSEAVAHARELNLL